ncbi:MAG: RNA polymerase sigma factor [Chitinophagales bacterium]|nr:RNA polymerase sigma factor [Chitinophagales bacterium]
MISKQSTDQQIIEHCIAGERPAQKALYDKYSSKMMGICLRYANDYQSAEDILQEGFVKAFRNIGKFRHEGSFEGWLRRIMVNTAIEIHRRKNNMYPILEVDNIDIPLIHEDAVSMLAKEDIMVMVRKLSPGYRTVFNLYAIEGYSHKEIAEQLNISEGTSKSQLARARYILMKQVEERTGYKRRAIG